MKLLAVVALACLILHVVKVDQACATGRSEPETPRPAKTLDLSKFDQQVVKQFETAWHLSKGGTSDSEGVVLIYRMADGTYKGKFLGASNEYKQYTFQLDGAVIAVVHTHPNNCPPQPSIDDMNVADKYGVLMFTITLRGMFVYDPFTKKISRVMEGIDWLDAAKWTDKLAAKMAGVSGSFVFEAPANPVRPFPSLIGWL